MKLPLYTLAASILFAVGAKAQLNEIEYVEYDLDNGLHVILHQDNSTPIVATTIMYHVGSKNEKPDRTGFAHFFEHLLFEGSQNIDRHEFDKYVEGSGGTLNANTSTDRTFYYELLPSNQLEMGLWLESERLLHAKVENVGIETQREVVKEEKRQRMDNQPYGSAMSEIFSRAYTKHPYQWPTIGSMDHLNAAQEEDYVGFYRTFYVPNNAVLSIAGDIDIKETKEMIDKYFGEIPTGERLNIYRDLVSMERDAFYKKHNMADKAEEANAFLKENHPFAFLDEYFADASSEPLPIPRPEPNEPPLSGEKRDTIFDNIQLPAVIQAFRIPAQGTDDFYAVDMLNRLLTRGESSRLRKKVVDEEEKAMMVFAFPFPSEHPGLALSFAISNIGVDPKELEESIDEGIERVQEELITDREFQKLRNQIENDFVSSNSTVAGRAESLANYHMYYGDANLINTEIKRYMAVTKEDIMRVAKKYFVPENRVILYYLPKEEKGS